MTDDDALRRMLAKTARRTGERIAVAMAAVLDEHGFAWRDDDARRDVIARHLRLPPASPPGDLATSITAVICALFAECGHPHDPDQVAAAFTRHLAAPRP